ncbi:hypothetical protein GCK32_005458 [Trichostrongylus colubriformis]|uniref:Uncharacterized protein n=1 Tax=Trichostrongylus colubriformis TaxID=6319 RepID=A0AAN8IQF6_TRICO
MSASDPLSDVLYQRLFRVFSYFADATTSGTLHPSQASFILDELNRESGRPSTSRGNAFSHDSVTFRELLNLVEVQFADRNELEPLVERIFERIVGQVIRKGFVLFRCPGAGGRSCMRIHRNNWRSGWCTISPGVVHVWPLDKQINNENRITTPLDQEARVSDPTKQGDRMVWELQSGKHSIHFAHFDPLACRGFVTDIRLAIERPTRSALQEFDQRRSLRYDGRRLDREVHERLQLETEKRRLEFELEQERLALKDEEIVRGLATRMLEEEKQRSEHMERVLVELQHKLGHRLDTVLEDEVVEEKSDEPEFDECADVKENGVEVHEEAGGITLPNGCVGDEDDPDDPEAWKKDDFLMVSTQSI